MSNRFVVLSAAAAFATYATVAAILVSTPASAAETVLASTVDGPQVAIAATPADAAATQSPGTVGAMHYATAGQPTSGADARLQAGRATAATVRWLAAPERVGS